MTGAVGSDWHLRDERGLLQRSLEDAAREHQAGDLGDGDYELLRARDERRLAEVDAALAALAAGREHPAPPAADVAADVAGAAGHRPRRRWWLAAAGVAMIVAASVILVLHVLAPRLPGQTATGSISLNAAQKIEQQIAQARTLLAQGKPTAALQLYGEVLTEDPRDPVALAEWGQLDWEAGTRAKDQQVAAAGAAALEEAVRIDRRLFPAQYYLGAVLVSEGEPAKAVVHFEAFLDDRPTARWLRDAAGEIRTAYRALGKPVPRGLPGG